MPFWALYSDSILVFAQNPSHLVHKKLAVINPDIVPYKVVYFLIWYNHWVNFSCTRASMVDGSLDI